MKDIVICLYFDTHHSIQTIAGLLNRSKSDVGKIILRYKKKYCISINDIAKLGIYEEFNAYPEGMLKEFKNCKNF